MFKNAVFKVSVDTKKWAKATSWEVINPDSVGNGTVTATFTSLSPIAFVAYNASAQTGETTPVLPIIVLICAAGIAVCGAKVKFNN